LIIGDYLKIARLPKPELQAMAGR